jgi:hypothetical protein
MGDGAGYPVIGVMGLRDAHLITVVGRMDPTPYSIAGPAAAWMAHPGQR